MSRLVGVRTPYEHAPARVRRWVSDSLGGALVDVVPRVGGMSPAVAATLVLEDGRRAFVKAVGTEVNPDTPGHFRNEVAILGKLPPAPYRPEVLATYDDGDWVALLLEDIAGGHPDLSEPDDRARVLAAVLAQADELTPFPPEAPAGSASASMRKHLAAIEEVTTDELAALPPDARSELPRLAALLRATLGRHRDESLCHWDIRHDNIVLRPDERQPVFVDWGMAKRARRWGDLAVFGLEWVHEPFFDELLARLDLSREEGEDVTGFLAGLAGYVLIASTRPPHPSLRRLPDFHRDLGLRCLAGVRRRAGRARTGPPRVG